MLELMIVIIIIGVLATIALPQFTKAVERAKAGKAINALTLIRQGESLYRGANDTYVDGADASALNDDTTNIGSFIELDGLVTDGDWGYVVSGSTTNAFLATATRTGGPNNTELITMDQTGAIDYSNWTP